MCLEECWHLVHKLKLSATFSLHFCPHNMKMFLTSLILCLRPSTPGAYSFKLWLCYSPMMGLPWPWQPLYSIIPSALGCSVGHPN